MIEVRGGRHHRGVVDVPGHRAHEVSWIGTLHIKAVRRHAREVRVGGRVNRHRVHDEAVIGVHHQSRRIVVAGHRVSASLLLVTQAVTVFIVDAIAVAVEVVGQRVGTVATVDGGVHVVVAGQLLHATNTAEITGSVVQGGRHIVVAGSRIRASCAARKLARAIVDGGRLIVVAGRVIGAPHTAHVLTRTVVIGRVRVVVAGIRVRAPDGLILITDSIAISIVDAIAVTIENGIGWVFTGAIIHGGVCIVVTRCFIRASIDASTTEHIGLPEVDASISAREHLGVELATEVSRCGELTGQDLEVGASDAIGVTIQGIPRSTDDVIDDNALTGQSSTRVEIGKPRIRRGLNSRHVGFSREGIRRTG